MKRFKNILYVTEYRETESAALMQACQLAQENDAALTIASILPSLPDTLEPAQVDRLRSELHSIERHRQKFVFAEELQPHREAGLEIHHQVLGGIPFIEVIRDVLREQRDLVVLPAAPLFQDGQGFSSMVMHLMRKCPCPVWAIRSQQGPKVEKILAAVDAGMESDHHALNLDILQFATSQARRIGAEVEVVHAWQVTGQELLRGPLINLSEPEWRSLHVHTEAAHSQQLDDLICAFDHEENALRSHLIEGDPVKVVPQFEEDYDIDLLVMGTVNTVGIEGYFMGHTSEEILQHSRCSVLAIKPVSFVSPVAVEWTETGVDRLPAEALALAAARN